MSEGSLFSTIAEIRIWLNAPASFSDPTRGYVAVSQLLEYIEKNAELLNHASRFIVDYRRSLLDVVGTHEGGEVDATQHPLLAPFIAEMQQWVDDQHHVSSGVLLTSRQIPVMEGDAIPGVRCVGCEG